MDATLSMQTPPKVATPSGDGQINEAPLSADELRKLDAYWRAANYLSVGQIYLLDNPLLTEPLTPEHIKPRLLGHWGTTPGLNILYAHLSRLIKRDDLDMIFVCGPGHGGPGVVASTWLEGTYSEIYIVLEGMGVLDVEGTKTELREGQAMFVSAGAEHRFSAYETLSLLVIFEKASATTT